MSHYPIFVALKNRKVVIIGGGSVAYRKIKPLIKAQANITLVSPKITAQIQSLIQIHNIEWLKQNYKKETLQDALFVLACTDNNKVNQQVAHDANQRNILVNVIDDPELCDFITPSVVEQPPVQIAFASAGASPSLMRYLRLRFEELLPQNLSALALFAQGKRAETKKRLPDNQIRQAFWDNFFSLAQDKSTDKEFEELYHYLLGENLA